MEKECGEKRRGMEKKRKRVAGVKDVWKGKTK